ncbi:kinase [Thraustotheca clavata]|uniref:Kinase n=1 Tax=Thraustotheca clavata TaxID=74557 RepID=A0A1V9Y7T1_9STRA|nr:kinase [Thraustotheca clavata]
MGSCCSSSTSSVSLPPPTIHCQAKENTQPRNLPNKVPYDLSASREPTREPFDEGDEEDSVVSPKRHNTRELSYNSRKLRSSTVRRMYGNLKKYALPVDQVFNRDISPDRFVTFTSYEYKELAPLQHEWWIDPTAIDNFQETPSTTMVCGTATLDEQTVFIKRLNRNASSNKLSRSRRILMTEVHVGAKVEHPYIATFLGFCITPYEGLSCVSEYVEGTLLSDVLVNSPQLEWKQPKINWALQLAQALVYLHDQKISHRNVKNDTILVTAKTCNIKLIGCGHAAMESFENHHPPIASEWSAPELLQGTQDISDKTDVYSFGLILLLLDTHKLPFEMEKSRNHHELLMKIVTGSIKPIIPASSPVANLMTECLQYVPTHRPSMKVVYTKLQQIAAQL